MASRANKELLLASLLLGFGLLVLPYAVYAVGIVIVGPYEGTDGPFGLHLAIWEALARGEWAAWVLVTTPYVVVMLLRLAVRSMRGRGGVTAVTD